VEAFAVGKPPLLPQDKPADHAVFEHVSLVSRRTDEGGLVRALLLESGRRPSIVIEAQSARGRTESQVAIDAIDFEGRVLTMDQVEALSDLAFVYDDLAFAVTVGRRIVDCTVPLGRNGLARGTVARCGSGNWTAQRPPPLHPGAPPDDPHRPIAPYGPQWARTPAVIKACGDAFSGQANELACLDRVNAFETDPSPAIRACEHYTAGDASGLACLASLQRVFGDPTTLIIACERATAGDANLVRCTDLSQRLGLIATDLPPIIEACEIATAGDENLLRCLDAVRGTPGGALATVQLVRACADAMNGDEATIACIGRR